MNAMFFNTSNMGTFAPTGKGKDEVSAADINSLLRGRTYGTPKVDDKPFEMNPQIPAYSEEDMKELQDYCAKRGIIGINFNGMNPQAVLKMLKAKMGERNEQTVSKKGMLYG